MLRGSVALETSRELSPCSGSWERGGSREESGIGGLHCWAPPAGTSSAPCSRQRFGCQFLSRGRYYRHGYGVSAAHAAHKPILLPGVCAAALHLTSASLGSSFLPPRAAELCPRGGFTDTSCGSSLLPLASGRAAPGLGGSGHSVGKQRATSLLQRVPWGQKVGERCRRGDPRQQSPSRWCFSCSATLLGLFV